MEVLYRRCAGLDVHQQTVVACARLVEGRKVRQEVETFRTLEIAGLKLTGLISNVLGMTGRAIVEAVIAGESDPATLAQLKQRGIKASHEQLCDALQGRVQEHHRILLRIHLDQIDALEQAIGQLEARMGELLEPFRSSVELLKTTPGIQETTARVILAEIGFEVTRFATAGQLISWAGLCPGSDESAGKHRSTRLRKGNSWLRTALVQAAWAASRKKDSYLRALYLRLRSRRGAKKAIVAVAASMLASIYFMLQRQQPYTDLGPTHFDQRQRQRVTRRLIRRLEDLGVKVEVKEAA